MSLSRDEDRRDTIAKEVVSEPFVQQKVAPLEEQLPQIAPTTCEVGDGNDVLALHEANFARAKDRERAKEGRVQVMHRVRVEKRKRKGGEEDVGDYKGKGKDREL